MLFQKESKREQHITSHVGEKLKIDYLATDQVQSGEMVRRLWSRIWPHGNWDIKKRVIVSVGLLLGSKVHFYFYFQTGATYEIAWIQGSCK